MLLVSSFYHHPQYVCFASPPGYRCLNIPMSFTGSKRKCLSFGRPGYRARARIGVMQFLALATKIKVRFSSVTQSCQLFATPWTTAHQASLSISNSQSLLKLISIELVMQSNHLILCNSLLLLSSIIPSTRVFSNESALHRASLIAESVKNLPAVQETQV